MVRVKMLHNYIWGLATDDGIFILILIIMWETDYLKSENESSKVEVKLSEIVQKYDTLPFSFFYLISTSNINSFIIMI